MRTDTARAGAGHPGLTDEPGSLHARTTRSPRHASQTQHQANQQDKEDHANAGPQDHGQDGPFHDRSQTHRNEESNHLTVPHRHGQAGDRPQEPDQAHHSQADHDAQEPDEAHRSQADHDAQEPDADSDTALNHQADHRAKEPDQADRSQADDHRACDSQAGYDAQEPDQAHHSQADDHRSCDCQAHHGPQEAGPDLSVFEHPLHGSADHAPRCLTAPGQPEPRRAATLFRRGPFFALGACLMMYTLVDRTPREPP